MKNGAVVAEFEREFASFVGAKYAIALCNGTATLHTALVALGVKPGDKVAVPPLTMSATTIAVLQAGGVPVFHDIEPDTWLYRRSHADARYRIVVDLYGLNGQWTSPQTIVDAAQTLRRHIPDVAFASYSFQDSKILSLGEGGMLVTDSEELATKAREFSSLGYRMRADQPRIDPDALKSPTFDRHYSLGWNYRMNDLTAAAGLRAMSYTGLEYGESEANEHALDARVAGRRACAALYREAIAYCPWLTPQHVPEGWTHDYWSFAVACDTPERAMALSEGVVKHGGEKPYPAWRLTYHEPAFKRLAPRIELTTHGQLLRDPVVNIGYEYQGCPVAESLQPRLLQFQTNRLDSAERNAKALRAAIEELS